MNNCNHIVGIHWNYDCTTLVEASFFAVISDSEKSYIDHFDYCPRCGDKLEVPSEKNTD